MQNHFSRIMAKRTDAELIKIVSVERSSYEPLAVEAAEEEMRSRNLDLSFVEEIKIKLGEELDTKENHIGVSVRVIHFAVDTFFFFVLAIGLTIAAMYVVPVPMGETEPMRTSEADTFEILFYVMFIVAHFLYYATMETFFQRTVGKFITGTKVVMWNGDKPQFGDILLRTCCRLIPFDNISFLGGTGGFHDRFSKTTLIKNK